MQKTKNLVPLLDTTIELYRNNQDDIDLLIWKEIRKHGDLNNQLDDIFSEVRMNVLRRLNYFNPKISKLSTFVTMCAKCIIIRHYQHHSQLCRNQVALSYDQLRQDLGDKLHDRNLMYFEDKFTAEWDEMVKYISCRIDAKYTKIFSHMVELIEKGEYRSNKIENRFRVSWVSISKLKAQVKAALTEYMKEL